MTDCWNEEIGAFTAFAGGEVLDAGTLLMPMVKMIAPDDPRFLSTLALIEERLVTDSLVLRYDAEDFDDGVGEDGDAEGTFSLCSFWYVEALTRVGRLPEARLALEKMFTYANHLGQYAEQVGLNGEQLGNFPQAFTHLSLVSAVINLDRSLTG
jgi:GH15 family glucan-1,4-alpha-glucosidase